MKTVLDMSFISELIMVEISIWNKCNKNYSKMYLTIDTGASVTTISTDILHKLGYDASTGSERRILTASSVEFVKTVNLEKIMLGCIELENVQVYAHTFPESSFSLGVIGLNVLKEFDVNLLFSNKTVELTKLCPILQ